MTGPNYGRRIETLDDVRSVLASGFASFSELLDCASVAQAAKDWPVVEDAGTALLICSTGRPRNALPSLQAAAKAIVASYVAGVESLDELTVATDRASAALAALGADGSLAGQAAVVIAEQRRWLDELRLLHADASAPSLVALCSKLREIDRADLGVEAATRALAIEGNDGAAYTTRAAAWMDQGRHPRAMSDIQKAWAIRQDAFTANAYSRILVAAGHPDKAVDKAEAAFKLTPNDYSARTLIAAAVAAHDEEALVAAKDFIERHQPTDEGETRSLWIEMLAARALLDANRLDEAELAIAVLGADANAPTAEVRNLAGRLRNLRKKQQGVLDLG